MNLSPLQKARYEYSPKLPGMLRHGIADICVKEGEATQSVADQDKIKALFPNTYGKNEITFQKGQNTSADKKQVVGVILSGGQAPGGHNVVCGLYDALKATNKDNVLYGFKGGPSGLLEDDYIIMEDEYIDQFRNTGGFDRIGDHPASPHLENSRNVLNGNYTSLTDSPLFMLIDELRTKHGDVKADNFGLDLITDDPLLDWQLRDQTGFRRSVAELTAAPDSDVILARSDSSFSAYGYAGTVIQYEEQMHWERFSFTDWGRWLLFGDGTAAERNALTLWAKGDMVYSAEE